VHPDAVKAHYGEMIKAHGQGHVATKATASQVAKNSYAASWAKKANANAAPPHVIQGKDSPIGDKIATQQDAVQAGLGAAKLSKSSGGMITSVHFKDGKYSYSKGYGKPDEGPIVGNYSGEPPSVFAQYISNLHQQTISEYKKSLNKTPKTIWHDEHGSLSDSAAWKHVSNPDLTHSEQYSVLAYGTKDYKKINPFLHHEGQVFADGKYRPATTSEKQEVTNHVTNLDSAFSKAKPTTEDLTVQRRTGNAEDIFGPVGSKVGQSYQNKAYTSTTTVPGAQVGHGYGYESKDTLLHVTLPKGSKVLKLRAEEHEILLNRGSHFTVTKDEKVNGTRHVEVVYHPNGAEKPDIDALTHAPERITTHQLPKPVTNIQAVRMRIVHGAPTHEQGLAVENYVGDGYTKMNEYLRNGTLEKVKHKDLVEGRIHALQSYIESSKITSPIQVKRVITDSGASAIFGTPGSRIGQVFTDKSFVSTSSAVKDYFGHVQLTYRLGPGAKAIDVNRTPKYSSVPDENEILLGYGQKFRVISDVLVDGKRKIEVEYVGQGTKHV
jgi:hypothetical protein